MLTCMYIVGSNIRLFAHDTSLFKIIENPATVAAGLNNDLDKISRWAAAWLISFNPMKTKTMTIIRKLSKDQRPAQLVDNQQNISC